MIGSETLSSQHSLRERSARFVGALLLTFSLSGCERAGLFNEPQVEEILNTNPTVNITANYNDGYIKITRRGFELVGLDLADFDAGHFIDLTQRINEHVMLRQGATYRVVLPETTQGADN